MSNGNNSSGSDDEQAARAPAFNWGLLPSEAAAAEAGLLKLPPLDSDPAADEQPDAESAQPGAESAQPTEPSDRELPDLVLPDSEPSIAEPPPTEALSAVDLPTGLMDVADLPTGLMDVADLPTGAMDVADLPTGLMDVADIPPGSASGPPTEAMNAADLPTRRELRMPAAVDPALEGATEVIAAHPVSAAGPEDESVDHDAVGALFGDEQFVEYEEEPLRGALVPAVISRPREAQAPRAPIPRGQLIAISIAAGLVAALALTALFLGGTKIGEAVTPVAVATPVPTDTASSAPAVGPLPVGTYAWDELLGGECLDPFESAWQDEYTVIECAQPHAAQLLVRGEFDDAVSAPFPELDGLTERTLALCSTDTVINFVAAKSFADLEVVASFAPNASKWEAGQREYYCFVTRSGDDALTESVAQPQAAAEVDGE
ncbi:septum formation family protein [Salinibacterium sp. PAMC 21357]|uniref:septum formation family protein n=1 Tax=Salinibacterium sp. PAMC 21357 TaxID=1112215 RepID=UPI0002883A4B|nr:septum formation family protein [Salinibacterium sp. PAMC 21357]